MSAFRDGVGSTLFFPSSSWPTPCLTLPPKSPGLSCRPLSTSSSGIPTRTLTITSFSLSLSLFPPYLLSPFCICLKVGLLGISLFFFCMSLRWCIYLLGLLFSLTSRCIILLGLSFMTIISQKEKSARETTTLPRVRAQTSTRRADQSQHRPRGCPTC